MIYHRFTNGHTSIDVTYEHMLCVYAVLQLGKAENNGRPYHLISAIKLLRELSKIGLKEAKDIVEILRDKGYYDLRGGVTINGAQFAMRYEGKVEAEQPRSHTTLGSILRSAIDNEEGRRVAAGSCYDEGDPDEYDRF